MSFLRNINLISVKAFNEKYIELLQKDAFELAESIMSYKSSIIEQLKSKKKVGDYPKWQQPFLMKTRSSAYVFFQTGNEFTRMGDTFSFDNGLQVFRHATLNSLLIKSLRGGIGSAVRLHS